MVTIPLSGHGEQQRGAQPQAPATPSQSRFGRMFELPPMDPAAAPSPAQLGSPGGPMDGGLTHRDNPDIAAVMTYFGQFIAHDMTADLTSSLEAQNDPAAVENFRTPGLDLDCLYGSGPGGSPHLYDQRPAAANKLLIGTALDDAREVDLPRNAQGVALVGDPRNDANLIIAQLHVAFIRFHNAVVDALPQLNDGIADNSAFDKAQRLVRWHYQWLVEKHFLPAIIGAELVSSIVHEGRRLYRTPGIPYIPIEFSAAAYRFGHSLIQPGYGINDQVQGILFSSGGGHDLQGGAIRSGVAVNWKNFLDAGVPRSPTSTTIRASLINTLLAGPLLRLPASVVPASQGAPSLAVRTLQRGLSFGLPSGQAVAEYVRQRVDVKPLDDAQLWSNTPFSGKEAPLWFYLLKEAEVRAGGRRLGPIGGRIVGEVILGLLGIPEAGGPPGPRAPAPNLRRPRDWKPTLGQRLQDDFDFLDLFRLAGVDVG